MKAPFVSTITVLAYIGAAFEFWAGPGSPVSLPIWVLEINANGGTRSSSSRLVKLLLHLTVPI